MPAGTPVQVRFPDEELSALDRYRREQRNPPSRAQAIRELTARRPDESTRSTIDQSKGDLMPTSSSESPEGRRYTVSTGQQVSDEVDRAASCSSIWPVSAIRRAIGCRHLRPGSCWRTSGSQCRRLLRALSWTSAACRGAIGGAMIPLPQRAKLQVGDQ